MMDKTPRRVADGEQPDMKRAEKFSQKPYKNDHEAKTKIRPRGVESYDLGMTVADMFPPGQSRSSLHASQNACPNISVCSKLCKRSN